MERKQEELLPLQDFGPRTVSVNGLLCAIGLKPNITAPIELPAASASSANLSSFLQAGYINIDGNRLVGVDGNLVTLNGANWFGFETQVSCFSFTQTHLQKAFKLCTVNVDLQTAIF